MPTRVIVGGGTAAAAFLQTMGDDGYETVVVGSDGLWAQLPDHPMGQPPHLLQLPGNKVPAHKTPSGAKAQELEGFLSSNLFQKQVEKIVKGHRYSHLPGRKVERISQFAEKDSPKIVVWFDKDHALIADQVICAVGIGQQNKPPPIEGKVPSGLPYTPIIEGINFLGNSAELKLKIDRCVYGGGATSAWVAALAAQTSPRMCWLARAGGAEFKGSELPGHRNKLILEMTKDHNLRRLEEVEKIKVSKSGKLKIYIKGQPFYYVADQFIYSLGGDAKVGPASMVDEDLLGKLKPFKDKNGALGKVDEGVLAWATPNKALMIVGAATYNFATPETPKQKAPMNDLPWNAQVPDGIAVAVSTISALNSYIPIKQKSKIDKNNKGGWLKVKITEI